MTPVRRIAAVGFFGVILVSSGFAQQGSPYRNFSSPRTHYANNGLYIGLATAFQTIGGEFDGESVLYGPGQVVAIPDVSGSQGYGVVFGGRSSSFGVEFSYLRSQHEATWLGAETDADYNTVNIDGKLYLFASRPVQIHLIAGGGFMWLNVKDGAINNDEVGDPRFQGFGLNLGAGFAYYASSAVGLSASVVYRRVSFGQVRGGAFGDIEGGLDGSGPSVSLGITYNLGEE